MLPLAATGDLPGVPLPRRPTLRAVTTLHGAVGATVGSVRRCRRECRPGPGPGSGPGRAHRGRGARSSPPSPTSSAWTGGPLVGATARCWIGRAGRCRARTRWTRCERPDRRRRFARLRHRVAGFHAAAGAVRGRRRRPVVSNSWTTMPPAGRFTARACRSPATAWSRSTCALTGRVEDTIELPVATTRLPAGSVLRAGRRAHGPRASCWSAGEVVRRTGAGDRHAAAALRSPPASRSGRELMRPSMVQKGAAVTMLLDSPGLTLTAQGQALESGAHRRAHPGAEPGVARGGGGRGHRRPIACAVRRTRCRRRVP